MHLPRATFICFGDSITEVLLYLYYIAGIHPAVYQSGSNASLLGWVSLLQATYVRRANVINHGYSGYITDWAVEMFPSILKDAQSSDVKLITIFFGANDSTDETNIQQHVPLSRYIDNTKELISIATSEFPSARVMLITPPPVIGKDWESFLIGVGEKYVCDRFNPTIKAYHDACINIVNELGNSNVVAINSWEMLLGPDFDNMSEEQILATLKGQFIDGLHFAAPANQKLADKIVEVINEKFEELKEDNLPKSFCDWDKVNRSDVKGTLLRIE